MELEPVGRLSMASTVALARQVQKRPTVGLFAGAAFAAVEGFDPGCFVAHPAGFCQDSARFEGCLSRQQLSGPGHSPSLIH